MNLRTVASTSVLLSAAALWGCAALSGPVQAPAPVTRADVANLTYSGILDEPVVLADGIYEGTPYVDGGAARPRVVLAKDLVVLHDLDGDGVNDAVAILTASGGGSGAFVYLAAISGAGGTAHDAGSVLLGDRVDIRSLEVSEDGRTRLRIVASGPNDPACCPMEEELRVFSLEDGRLIQQARVDLGRLSPASLADTQWRLAAFDLGRPAPEDPPVTLVIRSDGTFSGSSGCNHYMGTMTLDDAGGLKVSPMAGTQRMCPAPVMDVEDRYLPMLQGAHQLGFFNARLGLTYHTDDGAGVLLFEPAERVDE